MDKSYPINHWATTLVLGPLLPDLYEIIVTRNDPIFGDLEIYPLFILFGLLLSLPVLFIYLFIFNLLTKRADSSILMKLLLNGVVVAGIFVTFQIIKGSEAMVLTYSYSLATILSSLLFRIKNNSYTS